MRCFLRLKLQLLIAENACEAGLSRRRPRVRVPSLSAPSLGLPRYDGRPRPRPAARRVAALLKASHPGRARGSDSDGRAGDLGGRGDPGGSGVG